MATTSSRTNDDVSTTARKNETCKNSNTAAQKCDGRLTSPYTYRSKIVNKLNAQRTSVRCSMFDRKLLAGRRLCYIENWRGPPDRSYGIEFLLKLQRFVLTFDVRR